MADDSRIEALKKRLQKDPGSIAFAQLAEEYRRAGRFQEAIEVCRAGLRQAPGLPVGPGDARAGPARGRRRRRPPSAS